MDLVPPFGITSPLVNTIFNAIPIAILSFGFFDQYTDYLKSQNLNTYTNRASEEYDFVIVGGGSAGSVLANRLSANGKHTVLLLEAGGNPNPIQNIPLFFGAILHTAHVDYDFYTEPQHNACLALKEQRSFWPRGMGLGGSSNLNAMFYQRGNKNDYDKWAELSESEHWKFENILGNFKNVEDYHGVYLNSKYHSSNGKGAYVSTATEQKLASEFLSAGLEQGYPTADVNGLQEASFCKLDVTIKDGKRFGAYHAFLEQVLHRKNLQIYRYARVLKIHLDSQRRAYAVTYKRHGLTKMVKAKKEIILSAGALDTPKLLMLSGIGPKQHLQNLGIKPLVDLPVGRNLQDHIMVSIGPFLMNSTKSSFRIGRDITPESISAYFGNGTGPIATLNGANVVAYIYSELAKERMKAQNISAEIVSPDIQLLLVPFAPDVAASVEKGASFRTGYLEKFYGKETKGRDGFFVNVMLAKYYSRGYLKLRSADPRDKPIIIPKYFSHPDDIKILTQGIRFTVDLIEKSDAFKKHGAGLINKHLPGCEKFLLKSMEYYECVARYMTLTVYHHSGTCTMGKGDNDPKAVVDAELRVLKTKGLRVVDASIIPEIPNSNLNAAVYMLADKASEIILSRWR